MNFSHKLHKLIVTATAAIFACSQSHAMIVGSTCLTRRNNETTNPHKLVLLYDQHALDSNDPIKLGHVKDMQVLVDALAKSKNNVPFFVEISERQKDSTVQQNMPQSPGNVPIKLALDNGMHHKNITFVSFDARKHCDYWMRDMLMQRSLFAQAIQQRHQFPQHFYSITAETFLNHLKNRHSLVVDSIKELPTTPNVKEQDCAMSKKKYEDCNTTVNSLLTSYKVNNKRHVFDLIARLNDTEVEKLLTTLLEEQSFSVDMHLLGDLLKSSQKNPLCIVLTGMYHANAIEKRLLSQFQEFEKDYHSSMMLPNLKLDNLADIQCPNPIDVPNSFMNNNMKQFIGIE